MRHVLSLISISLADSSAGSTGIPAPDTPGTGSTAGHSLCMVLFPVGNRRSGVLVFFVIKEALVQRKVCITEESDVLL